MEEDYWQTRGRTKLAALLDELQPEEALKVLHLVAKDDKTPGYDVAPLLVGITIGVVERRKDKEGR